MREKLFRWSRWANFGFGGGGYLRAEDAELHAKIGRIVVDWLGSDATKKCRYVIADLMDPPPVPFDGLAAVFTEVSALLEEAK